MSQSIESVVIEMLDRKTAEQHLRQLVAIATDVPGEYWNESHFLAEFPEKWKLSLLARQAAPVGYAIVSKRADGHAHLHHLMVEKRWRDQGLGEKLLKASMTKTLAEGLSLYTLKVAAVNSGARQFYERCGFKIGEREGDYVWLRKTLA